MTSGVAMDSTARTYVKGFDGMARTGQLGRLRPDLAHRMAAHVAKDAPETAAAMTHMFDDARWDMLVSVAAEDARIANLSRQDSERNALSRRSGMTRAEIDRVMAGGCDREIVEARAALYRM